MISEKLILLTIGLTMFVLIAINMNIDQFFNLQGQINNLEERIRIHKQFIDIDLRRHEEMLWKINYEP